MKTLIGTCVASMMALAVATPALAQSDTYNVPANATRHYDLRLCGQSVHIRADGDNDTDLDFILRDDRGNTVHSDFDTTDLMLYTANIGGGCRNYDLEVRNLGDVYNVMTVTMTSQGNSSNSNGGGGGNSRTYRIDSNSTQNIDLSVCSRSVYMEARGDGDTDLDFTVYDDRGNQIHRDFDRTDWTTATLRTPGGGCYNYRLEVRNIGNVYNNMRLTLTDQ